MAGIRLIFLLPWLVLFSPFALAQNPMPSSLSIGSSNLDFVQYLMDNKEYEDAILVIREIKQKNPNSEKTDSLHMLLARAFYLQEKIDSSNKYFGSISSPASPFLLEAGIFLAFGNLYKSKYQEAEKQLNAVEAKDSSSKEFIRFMQASKALMQKDFDKFMNATKAFTFQCQASEWEQRQLQKWEAEQRKNKRKSPWLAGLMSAIVPGSGKYYAGYRGQAIASLTPCLIFGAAAVESYFRAGPKSFPFIASTSLFGLFYLGNIWGSALSVKTLYEQRDREIRHHLLLDIQIPMHRLFSQ